MGKQLEHNKFAHMRTRRGARSQKKGGIQSQEPRNLEGLSTMREPRKGLAIALFLRTATLATIVFLKHPKTS